MDSSLLSSFLLARFLDLLSRKEMDIVDNILSILESRLAWDKDLAAIRNNGYILRSASDRIKDDLDIVLAAVGNDGCTLDYASGRLKDDRDIVLAAVGNDGCTLRSASESLKDDREIINSALV